MAGLCALRNKVRVFPCKTGVKQSQALCSDGESVLACFCAIRCGTGIPAGCRGCPGGRYQREDRGEPREDGKVELYRLLETFNGFLWCPVMLVLLVGTGIYLNIALRFFSFRNWVRAYKCLWQGRSHQSEHGEISPWNALMTALAADIGTGNVVGVALAIAVGGPGALFWMWVTALVGMMTKFSEVLLSVHFREKTPAGNWVGGAMYFIKNGLGPKWVWLGTCFAVFGICACIGTGGMVQAKAITDNISGTFGLPAWL